LKRVKVKRLSDDNSLKLLFAAAENRTLCHLEDARLFEWWRISVTGFSWKIDRWLSSTGIDGNTNSGALRPSFEAKDELQKPRRTLG
jgi:hypothetical protein